MQLTVAPPLIEASIEQSDEENPRHAKVTGPVPQAWVTQLYWTVPVIMATQTCPWAQTLGGG